MDGLVAVIACAGAWLLFAGPLVQAAFELREESVHQRTLVAPARARELSPWWWLLPPVAIARHLVARHAFRRQQIASISKEELRTNLVFANKATGWLLVAGGALLIAVKETWGAGAELGVPEILRWVAVVGLACAVFLGAALQMARNGHLLLGSRPAGGRRGALRSAVVDDHTPREAMRSSSTPIRPVTKTQPEE